MNARRDKARRWVLIDRKSDAEIGHIIVVSYDAGPDRLQMEQYVNEARAESGWWDWLEKAYKASGYRPDLDLVAGRLEIGSKTLRKQCREHGITDWRDPRAVLLRGKENGTFGVTQGKRETLH